MAQMNEIGAVLARLAAAYPTYKLKKETAAVYAELLCDIPGQLLLDAAKQHIATSNYFPHVAELRKAAEALASHNSGPPCTAEAWAWVLQWIPDSGRNRTGGHDVIERAVCAIGGWDYLGQSKYEERHWTMKRFTEAYEDLHEAQQQTDRVLPDVADRCGITDQRVLKLVAGIGGATCPKSS